MNIKDLKGSYEAIATLDSDYTIENTESIRQKIIADVKKQGGDVYQENNTLYVKNSNYFFKLPTQEKIRKGVIIFRSKDFIFEYTDSNGKIKQSFCNKPKAKDMLTSGFTTLNFKNEATTWILSPIN